jgi:hypothetical protein
LGFVPGQDGQSALVGWVVQIRGKHAGTGLSGDGLVPHARYGGHAPDERHSLAMTLRQ